MQTLLFSVISLGSLALFRTRLLKMVQPDPQAPSVDQLVGEVAIATEDVAPGSVGKVELRGSAWSARNDAGVGRRARRPMPRDARGRSDVARRARRSPLMDFEPLTIVALVLVVRRPHHRREDGGRRAAAERLRRRAARPVFRRAVRPASTS